MNSHERTSAGLPDGFLRRLARDPAGNVLVIMAASLFPLLALLGSGLDIGRGYLAQTRLQQACDAGTLAARKRLGTQTAVTGVVPAEAADAGQRFFNINFRNGAYGSDDREFVMTLEPDYSISGHATATVPTVIMGMFGFADLPIDVTCSTQVNMPNADVMMVLDTTGSMMLTNPGDSQSRIDALRETVRSFHAQLEASKSPGTRIRYGFLPYSTNVNVGGLLQRDWLVSDEWRYNFREAKPGNRTQEVTVYATARTALSGTVTAMTPGVQTSCPASTYVRIVTSESTAGDGTITRTVLENGVRYSCTPIDANATTVNGQTFDQYATREVMTPTGTQTVPLNEWRYATFPVDLTPLQTGNSVPLPIGGLPNNPTTVDARYRGCVEERDTYEIQDYDNVDLSRALDLDLDRVPDTRDNRTKWRPMLHELSYVREVMSNGRGVFTPAAVNTSAEFINAWMWGFSACPSPARRLSEMTAEQVSTYVNGLVAQGSTYHDIGMIWGGRLLSPTGLFAADNANVGANETSRHLIYLTDGETAPLDISYGAYGVEPLDRRRWKPTSQRSLTQTVEARFSFACQEVRRRNIQVWVISFGTAPNAIMQNCAGSQRYFVANNAAELREAFSEIAGRISELRLVQ